MEALRVADEQRLALGLAVSDLAEEFDHGCDQL